tara:strand:+ start:1107 stop:1667 length:561 start_codon:yes stop_codon:yes gene_type:complete
MIYAIDNFLSSELLTEFLEDDLEFIEYPTPNKSFWVKPVASDFDDYVINKIENFEQRSIEKILSFFREAKEGQDDSWRIHNDTIIMGEQPDRAIVLFMDSEDSKELNGTAFWEHNEYGETYTGEGSEEFDRMLLEDAEIKDKWTLKSVIGYKQNRLLSYPCNYFHSKYPNEFKQSRKVFVMFYKVN